MAEGLLAARLVLALVFAIAGVAKLIDLRGSRQAMVGFGLPEWLAAPAGVALPLVELAVAVALVPGRTAWSASVAAALLLIGFIGGIGINLVQGRKPDCHCFGQLHSEPIGPAAIARNVALLAIAVFVVVEGRSDAGASAVSWIRTVGAAEPIGLTVALTGAAVLALQCWLMVNLFRQHGRLLVRMDALEASTLELVAPPAQPAHGLAVGTPAPTFSLPGLHGETLTLEALTAQGHPILLVFTSPACGPCSALMPDVARWQRESRDRLTVVLIARGSADDNRAKAAEQGLSNLLLQTENEVGDAYRVPGTPSAVLVTRDGTIATTMTVGLEPIRLLVNQHIEAPAPTAPQSPPVPAVPRSVPSATAPEQNGHATGTVQLGQLAPDFDLPDLDGRQVRLADLKGSDTMLLFWNTGCGFCTQMLDDLKAWEQQRPQSAPKIVVFSGGPADEIRTLGLRSVVVPDPSFAYGPRFGANGTPMAVMLDSQGQVASTVAAGAPAVLALARGESPPADGHLIPLQNEIPSGNGNGSRPAALRVGDHAPAFKLQDLTGRTVSVADLGGRDTLLLFWNTGCGFCQRMLPDLRAWEASRMPGAPEVVLVSAASADDLRAMGVRSTVLLDPTFSVGPRYGANGTPMGVLIDGDGVIASEMAVGADGVFTLLNRDAMAVGAASAVLAG